MYYVVLVVAGLLAGIATGLVGLSAAAVIVPFLSVFLGIDPYIAVGISLASDVFASATSAVQYGKNKNLDIKNGLAMLGTILIFTVIASYVSSLRDTQTLGDMTNVICIVLGVMFITKNYRNEKNPDKSVERKRINPKISSALWGIVIGIICGYIGAGGGVMLFAVLTGVLGYNVKTAVGTSVFVMTFTALTGAVSHIIVGGTEMIPLIICIITAFIGARVSSQYANKVDERKLNTVVGVFFMVFGIGLTVLSQFIVR